MPSRRATRQPRPLLPRRYRALLTLEELEARALPAAVWPGLTDPVASAGGNVTLALAQNLGTLGPTSPAAVVGALAPKDGSLVDFYQFTLDKPETVRLATLDHAVSGALDSVLSLYGGDADSPLGYRLLGQDDGSARGGDAVLERTLGAGTYEVGVSGAGNLYFSPLLAGSGYDGATGPYGLSVTAADPGPSAGGPAFLAADAGVPGLAPTLLSTDAAHEPVLTASPFALRASFSGPLDPGTVNTSSVSLLLVPPTAPGAASPAPVSVPAYAQFDSSTNEVVVVPLSPLADGEYRLFLAGDPANGGAVLAGPDGSTPAGGDTTLCFRVSGAKAGLDPNADTTGTLAAAHDLGTPADGAIVHAAGALGNETNDPVTASPSNAPLLDGSALFEGNTAGFDPNNVDLYHFRVTSADHYAFAAEVFAGRIGSSLDPALTLFRFSAPTAASPEGSFQFVASNLDTNNEATAKNVSSPDLSATPLAGDAAVYAGLTAGDYYLAIGSGFNAVALGIPGRSDGFLDLSAAGAGGNSVGGYVLNLKLEAPTNSPAVQGVTADAGAGAAGVPLAGATLQAPPADLTLHFASPMDLQQLAFTAYQQNNTSEVASVFVVPEGPAAGTPTPIYPRLVSAAGAATDPTFEFINALPAGQYALHLSGPLGLTDLAGNPLAGNDPSGDYVVHFTVGDSSRGSPGDPTAWQAQPTPTTAAAPQVLGTLFPLELQGGVTVTQAATDGPDYYQIGLIQSARAYELRFLQVSNLPPGEFPSVTIYHDGIEQQSFVETSDHITATLDAGSYTVKVSLPEGATGVGYQLNLSLLDASEPGTPLTLGPAPALQVRLVAAPLPPPPVVVPSPPPAAPPASPSPVAPATPAAPVVLSTPAPPTTTDPVAVTPPPTVLAPPVRSPLPAVQPAVTLAGGPAVTAVATPVSAPAPAPAPAPATAALPVGLVALVSPAVDAGNFGPVSGGTVELVRIPPVAATDAPISLRPATTPSASPASPAVNPPAVPAPGRVEAVPAPAAPSPFAGLYLGLSDSALGGRATTAADRGGIPGVRVDLFGGPPPVPARASLPAQSALAGGNDAPNEDEPAVSRDIAFRAPLDFPALSSAILPLAGELPGAAAVAARSVADLLAEAERVVSDWSVVPPASRPAAVAALPTPATAAPAAEADPGEGANLAAANSPGQADGDGPAGPSVAANLIWTSSSLALLWVSLRARWWQPARGSGRRGSGGPLGLDELRQPRQGVQED